MLRSVARVLRTPRGGRYDLQLVLGRRRALPIRGGEDALVARYAQVGRDVEVELLAASAPDEATIHEALRTADGLAGLDDDPSGFADVAARHPTIERLQRRFEGARLTRTATVFESFAIAVIGQLVTFEEARQSTNRLIYRHGAAVPGTELVAFPTAAAVASIPPHDLRALGVGLRRAVTLREGAARGPALERLRDVPPEEAIARIQSLRGVGIWTAQKVAIEALGWPDGVLVGDAGVPFVTTMALTGEAGGDDALLEVLEPFRPFRARVVQLFHLAFLYDHEVPGVPRAPRARVDAHRRKPWRA